MANELRTRDGLPFNFVDGLRIKGVDVTNWDKVFIDQGASYVGFTPVGNLAASNVQAAIAELESEKQSKTEPITTAINLRPGANQGIVWDNDAFGGTQDTASITLETASGEATKMRFKMTNDSDDNFEFTAKTPDGLTVYNNAMTLNGNVLLNAANYVDYAAPMITDYTALRAYTGSASQVRITTAGIAGFFYYDVADTTGADNGGTVIVSGNGKRWKRLYEGAVNVKWFGAKGDWNGVSGTDDTQALLNCTAESKNIYFPDGKYKINFSVASGNNSLIAYTDKEFISINGSGATIVDTSTYSGDYLTDIFKFKRCKNIFININCEAPAPTDPTAAYPNGIGYVGSSFLYFEEGCANIKIDCKVDGARYAVRSGNYSVVDYGYCSNFDIHLVCYKVGYPVALYLAADIDLDIRSQYQHRAAFLAGCNNVRGSITYNDFVYATASVLLTNSVTAVSAVDSDRRARGCTGVNLRITDNGSTGNVSARAIFGIAHQWKAQDTFFDDVRLILMSKITDVNRTLSGLRIENTVGWYPANRISNLKVSGVLDRSAQTLAASAWANISIDGADVGEITPYSNAPIFSNISFDDFNVINGEVTGNFDTFKTPNLKDRLSFIKYVTSNTTSIVARTGEVSFDKSIIGNLVTGDIVNRLNLSETAYGQIGAGIVSYPLHWYAGSQFTPVLIGSSAAGTATYSAQQGFYTRLGNRVHFHMQLQWAAHTGAGNMKITGLPYISSIATFCPVTVVPADVTSPANSVIAAMVAPNESAINIYSIAAGTSAFAPLAMDATGMFWISGTYEAK